MFGTARSGVHAYANVAVETGVIAASPHKLIVMLFDGALIAVASALQQMKANNIPAKGKSISKAISIIDSGLRASLNKKVGGDIALNLDALYEYMSSQLLVANIKNDPVILEEVQKLLHDLKEAWCAIDNEKNAYKQPEVPPIARAYDPLAPNISTLVKA
ncbi:flagellar export chaperone FliS [Herminiimonas sp. NPDC097707]|uniref:flagellar export chaperone FliS n=1 Tax=Herminiimonas sp. NPDC097707 TaxID=3364007 RepID=UPI00383A309B